VVVERKARTARNPKTGATIQVPAKKALKFRIAKAAKDAILGAGAPQQTGSAQLVDKAGVESSSSPPKAEPDSSSAL
jgi:hypothetical protein